MNNKKQMSHQGRFFVLRTVWDFLKVRKKWWLLPIIIMLLLVGLLIIFGEMSAMTPFIYPLY